MSDTAATSTKTGWGFFRAILIVTTSIILATAIQKGFDRLHSLPPAGN